MKGVYAVCLISLKPSKLRYITGETVLGAKFFPFFNNDILFNR